MVIFGVYLWCLYGVWPPGSLASSLLLRLEAFVVERLKLLCKLASGRL